MATETCLECLRFSFCFFSKALNTFKPFENTLLTLLKGLGQVILPYVCLKVVLITFGFLGSSITQSHVLESQFGEYDFSNLIILSSRVNNPSFNLTGQNLEILRTCLSFPCSLFLTSMITWNCCFFLEVYSIIL